jgi:RNA polymerase sigma-70 factor (ECF subfamily)
MLRRRLDPQLNSRIDADDVLSETFLLARRRWSAFREDGRGKAYPWLYRLALDCLTEAWRRETRECRDPRAQLPWPERSSIAVGFGLIHPGISPSAIVVREEQRQAMKAVLDLLPPEDCDLLRMRCEDALSHAECGEVLGISENASAVRYLRALKKLRDLWAQAQTDGGTQS